MTDSTNIVWLGRGGQGAFTAARLLGLAAVKYGGQQALAFPSFGPERRGAPVFAYTKIADEPISNRSPVSRAQAAVILDESLLDRLPTPLLHEDTLVVIDSAIASAHPPALPGQIHRLDARAIALELLGSAHTNTVLLGFLVGLSGLIAPEQVEAAIGEEFGTGARGEKNALAFRHAWALGQEAKP